MRNLLSRVVQSVSRILVCSVLCSFSVALHAGAPHGPSMNMMAPLITGSSYTIEARHKEELRKRSKALELLRKLNQTAISLYMKSGLHDFSFLVAPNLFLASSTGEEQFNLGLIEQDPDSPILNEEQKRQFLDWLHIAKDAGFKKIAINLWWRFIEFEEGSYDFSYYDEVISLILRNGFDVILEPSLHTLGGNENDGNCAAALPNHITEACPHDFFVSELNNKSYEFVSFWSSHKVAHHYHSFLHAVANHYSPIADRVGKMVVPVGPTGEARFPSYNPNHDKEAAKYPNRGLFQASGTSAIEAFKGYSIEKYGSEEEAIEAWSLTESDKEFLADVASNREVTVPSYGKFLRMLNEAELHQRTYSLDFLDFYHTSLLKQIEFMTDLTADALKHTAFTEHPLAIKNPGIHWQWGKRRDGILYMGNRYPEIHAGLIPFAEKYDASNDYGYASLIGTYDKIARKHPNHPLRVYYTAGELGDDRDNRWDETHELPNAYALPATLTDVVFRASKGKAFKIGLENALDESNYNSTSMYRLSQHIRHNPQVTDVTILRMSNVLHNPGAITNYQNLKREIELKEAGDFKEDLHLGAPIKEVRPLSEY